MDLPRLTLRQLRVFVAVARSGSTLAAADRIALSQSATSAAVNELERLLSLRLFDRTGRRLVLNENGRALLPRALALLDGCALIEQQARNGEGTALRELRIGTSMTIGNYVLPGLLRTAWGTIDPAVGWHSRVMIGNTEAVCAGVASFDLDVGLIEGRTHDPALRVIPWIRDRMIIVAAPDEVPLRRGRSARVALRALREWTWLLREAGSGTRRATDEHLLPYLHTYRRSIELSSLEAIKQAAAEGLGAAFLSQRAVQDLIASDRLREVNAPMPPLLRRCFLVMHRDKQPTPALRAFVAVAQAMS